MDGNVVSKLDSHMTIAPCLFLKKNDVDGISIKYLPEVKKWCMARYLVPGYPNKHTCRENVTHNHNWTEWGHYKMVGITIEFYRFFSFDMITLIRNSVNFVLNLLNFDQLTKTISRCEILNFHEFWARNVEMALVQNLLHFLHHPIYHNFDTLVDLLAICMLVTFCRKLRSQGSYVNIHTEWKRRQNTNFMCKFVDDNVW